MESNRLSQPWLPMNLKGKKYSRLSSKKYAKALEETSESWLVEVLLSILQFINTCRELWTAPS